jgi:hypothetical protein
MKAAETDLAPSERLFVQVGLRVRIRLPPADSLSLSCSRFRTSRTRLTAGVWGSWLDDQVGRDAQVFRYGAKRQQYLCRAIFQYRSVADPGGENATPARTKSGVSGL